MARKLFKRLMPARSRLNGKRSGRLQRLLSDPNVWHLNRNRVARGLATGLFWAWMPIPLPSLWASFCAWKIRGNVPLAFACCWIRNPLTLLPAIWISYRVGRFIIATKSPDVLDELIPALRSMQGLGAFQAMRSVAYFVWNNLGAIYPFLIGSLLLGVTSAVLAYFGTHALWRWSVVRRWRKRATIDP